MIKILSFYFFSKHFEIEMYALECELLVIANRKIAQGNNLIILWVIEQVENISALWLIWADKLVARKLIKDEQVFISTGYIAPSQAEINMVI